MIPATLLSTALLLCLTPFTFGQDVNTPEHCLTDSLVVSTGWDREADTSEIWRDADPYWRVVEIDVNPMPTSIRTAQARIVPLQCMIPLGESRWINGSSLLAETADGTWTYETVVCLDALPSAIHLVCDLLAKTETTVFFNDVELARTGPNGAGHEQPFHIEADLIPYARAGRNVLTVQVTGFDQSFVGFDLSGYITARNETEEKLFRCDGCGQTPPIEER